MAVADRVSEQSGHRVREVISGSIAWQLGMRPGDRVLSIDGRPIVDVFDYQVWQLQSRLLLAVIDRRGDAIEYEIEKDEDESLGLVFSEDLLDANRSCHNHCLFCFIDQLPAGMRASLYFKDDDLRLSFLHGNYVTMTNLTDSELDRLIGHRLSPVNVSVHTTDPKLRCRMMGNPEAGRLLEQLSRIARAGLAINAQIVLCPGLNDGLKLEQTLDDLISLGEPLQSVAVVPVGLTRFRPQNKLQELKPLDRDKSRKLLAQIHARQAAMLAQRQRRIFFAADEFYLLAQKPLPPAKDYEDFPQLENGVGMARQTIDCMQSQIESLQKDPVRTNKNFLLLVTATSFYPYLQALSEKLAAALAIQVEAVAIENEFFGKTITVAGLLTGQDLRLQLQSCLEQQTDTNDLLILLPDNLFKAGTTMFLDDMTLSELSEKLQVSIAVCRADGSDFAAVLRDETSGKGDKL